jgi:integrase
MKRLYVRGGGERDRNGARFVRARRFWMRFTDYRAEGGGLEPCVVPGERFATTDEHLAEQIASRRHLELEAARTRRQARAVSGQPAEVTLDTFTARHLTLKEASGSVSAQHLDASKRALKRAVLFFGADAALDSITPARVGEWAAWLQATRFPMPDGRPGRRIGPGEARHYLNCLSNLYRRAAERGAVPVGYNPVGALMDKPKGRRGEAKWLEVFEAALLLEAARDYRTTRKDEFPWAEPLIATALLTGGRPSEVLGLRWSDISFDRSTVTFRETDERRLKNVGSFRTVPLWPQLREVLERWQATHSLGTLMFPSYDDAGREQMAHDARKLLDRVAARVGWPERSINLYSFRHTYTASRLQTLDHGAPVSPYTVGRELGHGGDSLVKRIYGHLGTVRVRGDVVEYRLDKQPAAAVIAALQSRYNVGDALVEPSTS